MGWSACKPFKSRLSVSCSSMAFLHISLPGFQGQVIWELIFLVQVPRVGVPGVGNKPLALQAQACIMRFLLTVDH